MCSLAVGFGFTNRSVATCKEPRDGFLLFGKPLLPQLLTCPNDKQAGEEVDWDRVSDDREGSAELLHSVSCERHSRQAPNLADVRCAPFESSDGCVDLLRQAGNELRCRLPTR